MGGFECAYLWGVEMKYEITWGSDKDFEGAPDWATMKCHCTIGDPSEIKNENVAFSDGIVRGSRWVDAFGDGEEGVIHREEQWHIIAERRPITEPVVNQQLTTEFDSDGLPIVGTECEAKYRNAANSEWVAFRCVGVDCGVAFGWAGKEAVTLAKGSYEFRPIRSPEDVARDEATKAMNEVWREHAGKEHNGKLFSIYEIIYEGIAAGEIPGVKLE